MTERLSDRRAQTHARGRPLILITALAVAFVIVGFVVSLTVGAADISVSEVWSAIADPDPGDVQTAVIREVRLPRLIATALVGAGLAMAGAIMQALTRNPLAEPGLMGLNAGAVFALTIAVIVVPGVSILGASVAAFAGAALGAGLVYGIGALSRGGMSPVKLALAGASVAFTLAALSSGTALYFGVAQDIFYYQAGGTAGVGWNEVLLLAFFVPVGLVVAFALSRSLTVLLLGEEVAVGLGQRVVMVKIVASIVVLFLAGAAVAVAGPIAFVGLLIPHITRALVGVDYRWVLPVSALIGAGFLILADTLARTIAAPTELPPGLVVALAGVPFFLVLARRSRQFD